MSAIAPPAAHPRAFFGEPRALATLSFTEAWERFSYYGMTAILVLYMSQALLLPPRQAHVLGLDGVRHFLHATLGTQGTIATASQIFGLYAAFIYFTPVLGGLIADRLMGRKRAVALGAVLMSAGHFAMAFDASFLFALLLLVLGCGLLKGNISTQVGELYDAADATGRTRGFVIYSIGINVGAIGGPLICGLLAQLYGWHAGFGIAGLFMLCGLATYLAGWRHLPPDRPRTLPAEPDHLPAADTRRIALALVAATAITMFQSVAYNQNTNMALVFIDRSVDLRLFGMLIPTAWFNSIDPLISVIIVPGLLGLWRWQARHGGEPSDMGKIATGAVLAAIANALLAAACLPGGKVSAVWPLIYDILLGIAFDYYWPTLLALVSRTAPPRLKSTFMGAVFLSLFVANFIVGWLGRFFETMPSSTFWLLHAAIAAIGAVCAFAFGRPILRALQPSLVARDQPVGP